jgi:hypothetical protein
VQLFQNVNSHLSQTCWFMAGFNHAIIQVICI